MKPSSLELAGGERVSEQEHAEGTLRVTHLLRKCDRTEWGGTETALHRLCGGLRAHGVDPVIFCPALAMAGAGNPFSASGFALRRFNAFLPIWGIPSELRNQWVAVGGNLMSYDLFRLLWREPGISLVHTHTLGRLGGIGRAVARGRQLPFVVSIHGGALDLPPALRAPRGGLLVEGLEWGKVFGWLLGARRLFTDADAILTYNSTEADLLRARYPAKRIVVQRHGVPVEGFVADQRPAARAAFPQVWGREVLVCAGRVDPVKNQGWLVEQMPEVLRRHPKAMLVLAGACTDAAYGQAVESAIRRLGLAGRVLVTGGLPSEDRRLIGLLQEARAVLVPSLSETFGLVIVEAWAAGSPIVASRTSGARALVQSGENGWLFELDRPETFHSAIDRILSDRGLASRLAASGRELARAQFDSAALAGAMKDLYAELIECKGAVRHPAGR